MERGRALFVEGAAADEVSSCPAQLQVLPYNLIDRQLVLYLLYL